MNEMMAREIAAQASILSQIHVQLGASADRLARPKGRIFAGGCGDSISAPRALSGVFRHLGTPIEARTAMELASFTDFRPHDTVILSSISGSTKRTIEAAGKAALAGAHIIAMTCDQDSALAAVAAETVALPYTPLSRKTPHTLDYAVTLLALAEIARSFAGRPAGSGPDLTAPISKMLNRAKTAARDFAAVHHQAGKMMILGAGPDLGTAEYGAAKFHEAGGLIAIAAETENFIHGMNFTLDPQDSLLLLAGSGPGQKRAQEIATAFSELVPNICVHHARGGTPDSWQASFLRVLEQTFFLQHLCLEIANRLELNLEEPRAGRALGRQHLIAQSKAMAG